MLQEAVSLVEHKFAADSRDATLSRLAKAVGRVILQVRQHIDVRHGVDVLNRRSPRGGWEVLVVLRKRWIWKVQHVKL